MKINRNMTGTGNSATADGPRDTLYVSSQNLVETSCRRKPQQIEVMELEGYS